MSGLWLFVALLAGPPVGEGPPAAPTQADAEAADAEAPADAEAAVDPEALWDAARVALDHDRDPAAAGALLRRLLAECPDSRPADRARATLARVESLAEPVAVWALPAEAEADYLAAHPDAEVTPLIAIRHATTLPEPAALALLEAHRGDARWGWVVEREIGRRLYVEGHYVDAWQAARDAGDAGRVTASLRMMAWRAAPVVGVLLIALALWGLRRRRRKAPSASADRPPTVRRPAG